MERIDNRTKEQIFKKRKNWQSARSTIQKEARVLYNKSDKFKGCGVFHFRGEITPT